LEHDVELGLLLGSRRRSPRRSRSDRDRSRRRNAPLLFELLDERGDLHDGAVAAVVDHLSLGDVSHHLEILDSIGKHDDLETSPDRETRPQPSPPSLSFRALRTLRMPCAGALRTRTKFVAGVLSNMRNCALSSRGPGMLARVCTPCSSSSRPSATPP